MHTRSVNKGALWSAVAAATAFGCGSRSDRGSAAAAADARKRQLRLPHSKSVAEVAFACEHHGQAALVRGGDHFLIAHGSAGLNHRPHARVREAR